MSSADHTLAVDHRLKEAEVRNVKKRRIEAEARTLGNTQFEGVVWNRREKKWRAQKNVDLKAEALGDFDTAEVRLNVVSRGKLLPHPPGTLLTDLLLPV